MLLEHDADAVNFRGKLTFLYESPYFSVLCIIQYHEISDVSDVALLQYPKVSDRIIPYLVLSQYHEYPMFLWGDTGPHPRYSRGPMEVSLRQYIPLRDTGITQYHAVSEVKSVILRDTA